MAMDRFNLKALFALFVVAGLIAIGLAVVDAVLREAYGRGLFQRKIYGVNVKGLVLDGDTKKSISRAHVLVHVSTVGFFSREKYWFGVVADRNGEFSIKKKISRPLTKGIGICAVSSNEKIILTSLYKLTHKKNEEIPTIGEYMVAEDITLALHEMPEEYKRKKRFQYDTFSPAGMVRMEFIGKGWNAPGY